MAVACFLGAKSGSPRILCLLREASGVMGIREVAASEGAGVGEEAFSSLEGMAGVNFTKGWEFGVRGKCRSGSGASLHEGQGPRRYEVPACAGMTEEEGVGGRGALLPRASLCLRVPSRRREGFLDSRLRGNDGRGRGRLFSRQ